MPAGGIKCTTGSNNIKQFINKMKRKFLGWMPALGLAFVLFAFFSCNKDAFNSSADDTLSSLGLESRGPGAHGTPVSIDSLPASILEYIITNYPDSVTIVRAALTDEGNYAVLLSNHVVVVFDADGNFVEEIILPEGGHHGGGHHGGPGHHGTPIDVDSLSSVITDYINANYPDSLEILHAGISPDGNTVVVLSNHVVVVFDADGNFVEEIVLTGHPGGNGGDGDHGDHGTPVDTDSLSTAITDYISTNYPDAEILHAGINADGNTVVVLSGHIAVVFDADGNFIEEITLGDGGPVGGGHDHDGGPGNGGGHNGPGGHHGGH